MAEEDQRSIELAKTYFEFFKHLSTLNSAGAVVVVAISQARPEGLTLAAVPLLVFGISLLSSLSGMEAVLVCLSHPAKTQARVPFLWRWRPKASEYLAGAHRLSIVFFVAGLAGFAYTALG